MRFAGPLTRHAFAKALRTLRKARGLTQEDFALVSSRTHLSSLERAQKSPTLEKVVDLAQIIGVHPLTLFTLTWLQHSDKYNIDLLFSQIKHDLRMLSSDTPPIRLLIADDHSVVRDGLKQLFALFDDTQVVGEASSGEAALAQLAHGNVDVLLLDLSMPQLSGYELVSAIRSKHPALHILVLSMHREPKIIRRALEAGADCYLSKDHDSQTLLAAIRALAAGEEFVPPQLDA